MHIISYYNDNVPNIFIIIFTDSTNIWRHLWNTLQHITPRWFPRLVLAFMLLSCLALLLGVFRTTRNYVESSRTFEVSQKDLLNFKIPSFDKRFSNAHSSNWIFDKWRQNALNQCEGKFVAYTGEFDVFLTVKPWTPRCL